MTYWLYLGTLPHTSKNVSKYCPSTGLVESRQSDVINEQHLALALLIKGALKCTEKYMRPTASLDLKIRVDIITTRE